MFSKSKNKKLIDNVNKISFAENEEKEIEKNNNLVINDDDDNDE